MVRIPEYTRQETPDFHRVPQISVDQSIGQGLQTLGAHLGAVADRFQMRQEQQRNFDDNIKLQQHQVDTENAFKEAQNQMPANATGFHDQFIASRVKPDQDWLNSISPQNRDRYAAQWNIHLDSVGQAAADTEYKARGAYESGQLKTGLDTWMTRLAADPSAKPAALAELNSQVDSASSIPAAQKEAIKKAFETDLSTAKFTALYGSDPSAARRELGIPDPSAAAGAASSPADVASTLKSAAAKLGTAPENLGAAISYETGGKFSTSIKGGKGGNYLGLIQFGPEERAKYGVHAGQSFGEQMGAVVAYLKDRGFKPGMSLEDLYSTINAGSPGHPDASDGPNQTVRSHVDAIVNGGHLARAQAILGGSGTMPADAGASRGPIGGNPEWSSIPYADRFKLINSAETQQRQDQAFYRVDLEQRVHDASAAMLTTGRYDGSMPSSSDFSKAYGQDRGPSEYQAFQRTVDTGRQIDAIKTMTPAEQSATLEAAKPANSGPGFAAEQTQYETLQKAVAINQQQRSADPASYVQSIYPKVKAAWTAAGQSPAAFQTALATTAAAQQDLGIAPLDQRLLPTDVAKKAADTFKQPDLAQDQRIGSIASIIFATADPHQQTALFRQLVDAGLPDMTEGAVRAYARGDKAAAERLMKAAIVDPKALPGKLANSEDAIKQEIQNSVMADGAVGDLAYGLSFGRSENLISAERDGKLLTRSVQLRMAGGEDMNTAVQDASRDLFGPVKPLSGQNINALVPETADETAFSNGVDALLPKVGEALHAAYPGPDAKVTGAARAVVEASRENRINDVLSQGVFRNASGGFGFLDPYTHQFVAGQDGKPLTFTMDQILAAGKEKPADTLTGPGDPNLAARPVDPLAQANDPNSAPNSPAASPAVAAPPPAPQATPQAASVAPLDAVATGSAGAGASAQAEPGTAEPLPAATGSTGSGGSVKVDVKAATADLTRAISGARSPSRAISPPVRDPDLDRAKQQLPQEQQKVVELAIKAMGKGVDQKVIEAGLRRAGVPESVWPK